MGFPPPVSLCQWHAFDPREATFNRYNAWYGEPELEEKTVFVNAGYDLPTGATLYGWASWQDRDARSAGFYRPAQDARNVIEIYPDGFLPIIAPEVTDWSAAGGVRWKLGEWDMDSSLVYGKNEMEFTIENTLNRSLGPASKPCSIPAVSTTTSSCSTCPACARYPISVFASPLNVAVGVEARLESYSIFAGEPDSYRNGGVLLNGQPTASGAQVFPGFRPSNEVDEDRTAVGAYIDLEANITEKFLASVALRGESYSDFGENLSGKLSMRYDFTDKLRAARLGAERLPRALAAAAVLRHDLDELHRRRAVRHHDVPGVRSGRAGTGRPAARRRGVRQLLARRGRADSAT